MSKTPTQAVIVLNSDGTMLMPTKRFGQVRRWLKSGRAKIVSKEPFTIQFIKQTTDYAPSDLKGLTTKSGTVHLKNPDLFIEPRESEVSYGK